MRKPKLKAAVSAKKVISKVGKIMASKNEKCTSIKAELPSPFMVLKLHLLNSLASTLQSSFLSHSGSAMRCLIRRLTSDCRNFLCEINTKN